MKYLHSGVSNFAYIESYFERDFFNIRTVIFKLILKTFVTGIAHVRSYELIVAASCWIGLNKGLRTVFMALVIPSYVPLARLPAATGLQLLFAGIFYFVVGPFIGLYHLNAIVIRPYVIFESKN